MNQAEKNISHMQKIREILGMEDPEKKAQWLTEYVDFHIKMYGIKESKRIARKISSLFPEFSQALAGIGNEPDHHDL